MILPNSITFLINGMLTIMGRLSNISVSILLILLKMESHLLQEGTLFFLC